MIEFKKIKYRNFLSTGKDFTEITLNDAPSTLIVGQNGAGKSTMLDALSFALFGKAHRNVTKGQLVNSINNGKTVVEVEFGVNGKEYRIVRGIKPVKFEIYCDGDLINQNSHTKEYQQLLEQNILKLNHKSFHQIVVLGSSSFIPFMQLPASHRREVIEDLLDINVFSKMNTLLRGRMSILKEDIRIVTSDISTLELQVETQETYVQKLEQMNDSHKKDKEDKIESLKKSVEEIRASMVDIDMVKEKISTLNESKKKLNSTITELRNYEHQFGVKQKELMKEAKFYESNTTCPTCDQDIATELKEGKLANAKSKFTETQTARVKAKEKLEELTAQVDAIKDEVDDFTDMKTDFSKDLVSVTAYQNQITELQKALETADDNADEIREGNDKLIRLQQTLKDTTERKIDLSEKTTYNTVIFEMLKDTGIKTKIIKQYLPVINKLVNQYLQVLDFYVSFTLDDTFKETIRSRHRDTFSYESFSEGEKQRIDLALLFTWRQIARMKNSVATNLLVLDETFDSSLDGDGVDNLTRILDTLDSGTNVFIISHKRSELDDKFDKKIEFVKPKNFSYVS